MGRATRQGSRSELWPWIRARVRMVGSASLVGGALAALVVVILHIAQYDLALVSTQVFAFGALCFGFGLLGWSGSVLVGRSIENAQQYLDTGTNWTESGSRRAMARIGGLGFGGMLGVIVVTSILGL